MNNYRIIWTNESLDDLLNIEEFLGNNAYADKMIDKIIARSEQLQAFPLSGQIQPSKSPKEYRYLIEGDYKIIYSFRSDLISIHAIFDTRQDPDKLNL